MTKIIEIKTGNAKYNIGDTVWRICLADLETPIDVQIAECVFIDGECHYKDSEGYTFPENAFAASRDDLIDYQVVHWTSFNMER